jgi:hypothetical protein
MASEIAVARSNRARPQANLAKLTTSVGIA